MKPTLKPYDVLQINQGDSMTPYEALALLWDTLLYLQDMAYRQRTDENRRNYNTAMNIVRDARNRIEKEVML